MPVSAVTVGEIHSRDTGGRSHVDVAFDPFTMNRAAIVDCDGGVWIWKGGASRTDMWVTSGRVTQLTAAAKSGALSMTATFIG